jgi:transcriptional regulator with XRE-family HTH domain
MKIENKDKNMTKINEENIRQLFLKVSRHFEYTIEELEEACCELLDIYKDNEELVKALNNFLDNYKLTYSADRNILAMTVTKLNPYSKEDIKKGKDEIVKALYPKQASMLDNIRENINHLAIQIKSLRITNNLTTEKLSELSGVSGALINKIENCKVLSMPKHSTLEKLATAFNIDISELTNKTEVKNKITSKEDLKLLLINLGYKAKYINQIIDYADTIMLKQKIEEGEINV